MNSYSFDVSFKVIELWISKTGYDAVLRASVDSGPEERPVWLCGGVHRLEL